MTASDLDHHTVVSVLGLDGTELAEHLAPEVGEHHAPGRKTADILLEVEIVYVEVNLRIPETAFAEKQIGIVRTADELLRPPGVTRVDDHFPFVGDPIAVRRLVKLVGYRESLNPNPFEVERLAVMNRPEPQRERYRPTGCLLVL